MIEKRILAHCAVVCIGTFSIVGCQAAGNVPEAIETRQLATQIVRAPLFTAAGKPAGEAIIAQGDNALLLTVEVSGQTPGLHGIHIHTIGKCTAPDFSDAGGHWNPTGHAHGSENPAGPHEGDLPNIMVGADGNGELEMVIEGASLHEGIAKLLDDDGAAMVLHASQDDLKTDPSGNSGARLACGVFVPE